MQQYFTYFLYFLRKNQIYLTVSNRFNFALFLSKIVNLKTISQVATKILKKLKNFDFRKAFFNDFCDNFTVFNPILRLFAIKSAFA